MLKKVVHKIRKWWRAKIEIIDTVEQYRKNLDIEMKKNQKGTEDAHSK